MVSVKPTVVGRSRKQQRSREQITESRSSPLPVLRSTKSPAKSSLPNSSPKSSHPNPLTKASHPNFSPIQILVLPFAQSHINPSQRYVPALSVYSIALLAILHHVNHRVFATCFGLLCDLTGRAIHLFASHRAVLGLVIQLTRQPTLQTSPQTNHPHL